MQPRDNNQKQLFHEAHKNFNIKDTNALNADTNLQSHKPLSQMSSPQ